MITKEQRSILKDFLPYGYTQTVKELCDERGIKMPRGGEVTRNDIRNTLDGREHLEVEKVIYEVYKINKAKHEDHKRQVEEMLESKKPEGVTSGS